MQIIRLAIFPLLAISQVLFGAQPVRADSAAAKYMGVGSCSSSNCHGSTSPRQASNILQNEYVTWSKHDKHAQAWNVLGGENSRIMAKHLGIVDPQKEGQCLACHATYRAGKDLQGEKFTIEDGVSCESCHGASERWLNPHAARGAVHAKNLELGMSDLVTPEKRAKLCISCHIGGNDKSVTHDLIGAGHPRLNFELDTFGALQPWHWAIDDDYKSRKSDYSALRYWLVGQLEIAQLQVDALLNPKTNQSLWPELTLFNCYSCHHSLKNEEWKHSDYSGRPGQLRPNVSSVIVLGVVLSDLDHDLGASLSAKLDNFLKGLQRGSSKEALAEIKNLLSAAVKPRLAALQTSPGNVQVLLKGLATFGQSAKHLYYEEAEQLAMGISALIAERWGNANPYKNEVDALYAALRSPAEFRVEEFRSASAKLARKVNS